MPGGYITQIVQGALLACVTRGELTAARTRRVLMVAMIQCQLRLWEILDSDHALGGVWQILAGTEHGKALLSQGASAWNLRHLLVPVMANFHAMVLKTPFF